MASSPRCIEVERRRVDWRRPRRLRRPPGERGLTRGAARRADVGSTRRGARRPRSGPGHRPAQPPDPRQRSRRAPLSGSGSARRSARRQGTPRCTAMPRAEAPRRHLQALREADKAWQRAEALLEVGRPTVTRHGAVRFIHYVDEQAPPPCRRADDEGELPLLHRPTPDLDLRRDDAPRRHRTAGTLVGHVDGPARVSPATIRHVRIILSAVFTTAVNDRVIPYHPGEGIKTPTVPVRTTASSRPTSSMPSIRRSPTTSRVSSSGRPSSPVCGGAS
jgi:hypothetical protein